MKLREMLDADLITLDDDPSDGRRKRMGIGHGGRVGQELLQARETGRGLMTGSASAYQPSQLGD